MKKSTISLFIICLIFVGGIAASPYLTKNNTSELSMVIDLLNPLVKESTVYVKTNSKFDKSYEDNSKDYLNYAYITTSYNEQGAPRDLRYTSFGKELTPNRFLKLTTKGQNVRRWEEVTFSDLPKPVQTKLK